MAARLDDAQMADFAVDLGRVGLLRCGPLSAVRSEEPR